MTNLLIEPAFQRALAHLMGDREIDGDAEVIFREFLGWYLEEVERQHPRAESPTGAQESGPGRGGEDQNE